MNACHHDLPADGIACVPAPSRVERAASKEDANETVSLLLDVLFDSEPNKLRMRIARTLFSSRAQILLIPRQRPVFSMALSADEFFSTRREVIRCDKRWTEAVRVQEPYFKTQSSAPSIRIYSEIVIDAEAAPESIRRADALFVLGLLPGAQRVQSCTLVYDEASSSRSPLTLY